MRSKRCDSSAAGFRLLIAGKGRASYETLLESRSRRNCRWSFVGFVSLPEFFEKTTF